MINQERNHPLWERKKNIFFGDNSAMSKSRNLLVFNLLKVCKCLNVHKFDKEKLELCNILKS